MRRVFIDLSNDSHLCQPSVFGGYAGEHNETQLEVKLPKRMVEIDCSGYYFDFQTADDKEILSPLLNVSQVKDNIISFKLAEQLTVAGKLKFNIKAVLINQGSIDLISKTSIAILHIDCSPEGTPTDINPENYKDEFLAMIEARVTEMIQVGQGNITVNLPIDTTYSSTSTNAQSGKALEPVFNAKQNTLVSGENIKTINNQSILGSGNIEISGGSSGNITVDQDYDSESENAQSGTAVAEAIKSRIGVFNPETEVGYMVGDIVFVQMQHYDSFLEHFYDIGCVCICKKNHIPSDIGYIDDIDNRDVYNDEFYQYWEVHELAARKAERAFFDIQDNIIHEHYATKNELKDYATKKDIEDIRNTIQDILEIIKSGGLDTKTVGVIQQMTVSQLEELKIMEVE